MAPSKVGALDLQELSKKIEDPPTEIPRIPNRLILCFDGTGNSFQANTQDTNIVKLYDKFDRDAPHQMHYYQPGIGTYASNGESVSNSWFGKIKSSISKTIDQGLATSFEAHVCSGYRFLMRYYGPGDHIYIFGFSRGAFTARYLARMVSEVGLLSMGNEELVPFAYQKYYEYVQGQFTSKVDDSAVETAQQKKESADFLSKKTYLNNFKITFCRHENDREHRNLSTREAAQNRGGIKPYFLGLFDTVSSVGAFDVPFTNTMKLPQVGGTAQHIRHAVALDEYRVKFKVDLLTQDIYAKDVIEDVKEVWFPGNHGDCGGGWSSVKSPKDSQNEGPTEDVGQDKYQLSDIALRWMINELEHLEGDKPQWNPRQEGFLRHFNYAEALGAPAHNTMIRRDASWYMVALWWFLEYVPFIKRWEYYWVRNKTQGTWKYVALPPNMGSGRDIPPGATFHTSVVDRFRNDQSYKPTNDIFLENAPGNTESSSNVPKLSSVLPPGGLPPGASSHHLVFQKKEGVREQNDELYSVVRT